MSAATIAVSSLLALALAYSAARKLSHRPEVVATYTRVGVPEDRLNHLAVVLLAAAVGLVVGLFWAPIGIAAAIGLIVYFVVAIAAHVRHHDTANASTPVAIELMAIAVLVLQFARLL
jgi:DoxX-like family